MNFKTFFFKFTKIQHTKNRLTISYTTRSETGLITEDRARDLVDVHSNLRLLENIRAVNYVETTVEWEQWAVADSDYY